VLVIPRAHEDAVLAAAEEIDAVEQKIRSAVNGGETLSAARKSLGYHQLQARRNRTLHSDAFGRPDALEIVAQQLSHLLIGRF